MKKYGLNLVIFLAFVGLLPSAFAMEKDVTPEEKRELLARVAERRLRLQQQGLIEEKQEAIEEILEKKPVHEEEEEPLSMAERIEHDRKCINEIVNPANTSQVTSLTKLCLESASKLFIPSVGRVDVTKLLESSRIVPHELRRQLIINMLQIYEKSNDSAVVERLLKKALLNYGDNLKKYELPVAMILMRKELSLIFSLLCYKNLTKKEHDTLKRSDIFYIRDMPLFIEDIFRLAPPHELLSLEELAWKNVIARIKIGFIDIDAMIRLLDKLDVDKKIKLMSIITGNPLKETLNFSICYELFKSLIHYNHFKYDFRQWQVDRLDREKLREDARRIISSRYYKALSSLDRGILQTEIKKMYQAIYFNENIVDDVFLRSKLYRLISSYFANFVRSRKDVGFFIAGVICCCGLFWLNSKRAHIKSFILKDFLGYQ